jgi:hypothetical protein
VRVELPHIQLEQGARPQSRELAADLDRPRQPLQVHLQLQRGDGDGRGPAGRGLQHPPFPAVGAAARAEVEALAVAASRPPDKRPDRRQHDHPEQQPPHRAASDHARALHARAPVRGTRPQVLSRTQPTATPSDRRAALPARLIISFRATTIVAQQHSGRNAPKHPGQLPIQRRPRRAGRAWGGDAVSSPVRRMPAGPAARGFGEESAVWGGSATAGATRG